MDLRSVVVGTSKNKLKELEVLLQTNDDVKEQINSTYNGYTLLHEATMAREPLIVECLLKYGAHVDSTYHGELN